ncbi:hypothetical protein BHF71_07325 [Vulcanibacillus modesticaldus]|uniref:Peptidase M14 n=1 Tax=Vulcanibacillus modesticaldus TaxID=337097 RepID=A0A1D2YW48_9BACI|nr:M14 family zinc carboxypeptidase [Vulcanibacillus modesticaldus]OEF99911.1 hypothetical protein BHF71_07325 [Vulcanibacillus modesticaldus]
MRYVAQKGDTTLKIANRFGITLNALYIANPQLERGEYIYPGQLIEIPQNYINQYVVQPGDTLHLIGEKFGITVSELTKANPHFNGKNKIYSGQIIFIPRPIKKGIVQTNHEYGYKDMVADLIALKKKYPFLHYEEIGNSVMGKTIYAIRLGKGDKMIFYSADWHANEYLTAPLLMKFVEDYAKHYEQKRTLNGYDINYLFNNVTIWLVPMVNPDGVELVQEGITPDHPYYQSVLKINNGSRDFREWTANIRGVDLNHQWPADWENVNARSPQVPSPSKYGGYRPLTEPEVRAIYNFTKGNDFSMVIPFHSQGREIFWGFKGLEPKESVKIVNRFAVLTGYIPVRNAYNGAGFKDWFIQEFRRPGFTVEVGKGLNPLSISKFSMIYRNNLSLLLEAPLLISHK